MGHRHHRPVHLTAAASIQPPAQHLVHQAIFDGLAGIHELVAIGIARHPHDICPAPGTTARLQGINGGWRVAVLRYGRIDVLLGFAGATLYVVRRAGWQ